jgi:hypothetical protein
MIAVGLAAAGQAAWGAIPYCGFDSLCCVLPTVPIAIRIFRNPPLER